MCVCVGGGGQDRVLEDNLVGKTSGTKNQSNNIPESGTKLEETTGYWHPLKNSELWKQNIRKRNAGDECTSCKGEKVKQKIADKDSNAFKTLKMISRKYLYSIEVLALFC